MAISAKVKNNSRISLRSLGFIMVINNVIQGWCGNIQILKLLLKPWASWLELTHNASDKARQVAAEHGNNWDVMSEEEKEFFIDELVHKA